MRRPTIILVHGGWQGPEVYGQLVSLLEKAHYSVFCPKLPSAGTIPATPSFDEDVKSIRNAVGSVIETGKEVVVVMHSYGAVPGCEALKGLKVKAPPVLGGGLTWKTNASEFENQDSMGGIVKLVFLAAMVLPVGGSTWSSRKGNVPIEGFGYKDDLITILDAPTRFYNDLPAPDAEYWTSRMKPQSRPAYSSVTTYAAWRHISSAYLLCTRDQALPAAVQERYIAMAGIKEVTRIDTGHSPHLSQPRAVAKFVRRAAGENFAAI